MDSVARLVYSQLWLLSSLLCLCEGELTSKTDRMPTPLHCCYSCGYYSRLPSLLLCALHPETPPQDYCPDYAYDPSRHPTVLPDPWEPFGASFECDEGGIGSGDRFIRAQRLLDWHPLFTGRCPDCGAQMEDPGLPHWDCKHCGWCDESP